MLIEDVAPQKSPVLSVQEVLEPIPEAEVLKIYSDAPLPHITRDIASTEVLEICADLSPPLTSTVPDIAPISRSTKLPKKAIRSSLKASTCDSVFSTLFAGTTGDVLLSNFMVGLGATSVEIGLLSAIAMVTNFLQPIGAYLADRTTSRRRFSLQLFLPSRLLWLILVGGIFWFGTHRTESHHLVQWTLALVLVTHILGALGSPSWVSWMAVLVPQRLRGRYFGLRNSVSSLTNLIGIPLLGLIVSTWGGGTLQGYGVVLTLGVLAGLISLGIQFFKADVNPQAVGGEFVVSPNSTRQPQWLAALSVLKNPNYFRFLVYYGLFMFSVSLSAPFFNVYMLKDLGLDVSWVTIYSSLVAGANLVMLVVWGKLADRIGNRPVLVVVGILIATIPLLWLGAGTDSISVLVWLPLLHLLMGGAWSAMDLCNNNIQMAIAPAHQSSSYFAMAAAVGGLFGALGTTAGGFLAQSACFGGLPGLFALSAVLRLVALLPLVFVREPRSRSLETLFSRSLPRLADKTPKLNISRVGNR